MIRKKQEEEAKKYLKAMIDELNPAQVRVVLAFASGARASGKGN
ncbi:hypothetical protein [Anaerotignum sp.]